MRTLRLRRIAQLRTVFSLALGALVLLEALWAAPTVHAQTEAEPEPTPRVRIERSPRPDPLIDEAVVRILGEMSIVGLDVEVLHREGTRSQPLEGGTWGLLSLRREAEIVRIEAWGPGGGAPYTLDLDTRPPEITAEVVAIRGVEALRAKWLEYGELGSAPLPERVLAFARAQEPSASPPPKPTTPELSEATAPPERPMKPKEVSPSSPPPEPSPPWGSVQLGLGSSLMLETPSADGLSLDGQLLFGRRGWFLGGSVGGALRALALNDEAGAAQIERKRFLGLLQAELELDPSWQGFLQLGFGVHRYEIDASATEPLTLEARDTTESRLGGVFRIGMNHWFHPVFGLYAEGELGGLMSALVVRMDERAIATLGGPAMAVGFGVKLRAPLRF